MKDGGPGDGGPALFRLVRFWSRRWARGVAAGAEDGGQTAQHVLVVDAVDALRRDDVPPTVGHVATQLGLDRSGASRMIAAAAEQGYLERPRARADARRSALALTPAGQDLLDEAKRWQRATFDELTDGWSAADRARFAGYLERLAKQVGA